MNEQNKQTQNTANNAEFNPVNKPKLDSPGLSAKPQDNFQISVEKPLADLNTESAKESVKESAKGIYDQAKNTAGQAYGVATKKATEAIEEKKGDLAGGLTSVAESIKQVGETLRETDTQNQITATAAKYSDGLAQQIEKVSKYFENKDVREMVGDAERFARRNPALFIGAALGVGFLAARFLKSSPTNYKTKVKSLKSGNHTNEKIENKATINPS